jgi:DNA-binding CsgD family transcriptional regulator
METLSIDDLYKLNQAIQQIYTLNNLDTFAVEALTIIDRLVPSEFPMFHLTHCRAVKVEYTFLEGFMLSSEMERTMHQNFGNHPIVHNMPQTLIGAHKISDFVSQQELHSFEGLYHQFCKLGGIEEQMVFFLPDANPDRWEKLSQTDTTLVGFAQNRDRRNFTEGDRLILNLLYPHLAQAYTNAQQYQQLQQELIQVEQLLNHLDAIMVGGDGMIESITPQAIIWLASYFPQPTCADRLPDCLQSWLKYQVTCLDQNLDLGQGYLPLRIQQSGRELTIRLTIESRSNQYLLLLEEQTLSSLKSLVLLGLSQRETEVLALIIQGKDNKVIASQLIVNISTIRKHLENIYTKLGVSSRTEAIAHALTKLGFF